MPSLSHIDPVWVIILISPLLFTPVASQGRGEEDTGKIRRQVFREDVSPLLGGKIPSSAFHWSRLMFNNLDSRGISIPDGRIPSSDRLQEGRSDGKRLTLFSEDELNPTIPSTYFLRDPVSFELYPNPDEKPEPFDHDDDDDHYYHDVTPDIYEYSKNPDNNEYDECAFKDKCPFYEHDEGEMIMDRPHPDYNDGSQKPLLNNHDDEAEDEYLHQPKAYPLKGNFAFIKDSKGQKSSHLRHKQPFTPNLFNNQLTLSPTPRRVEVHVFAPISNANTLHDHLNHPLTLPLNEMFFQMKKFHTQHPLSFVIFNSHQASNTQRKILPNSKVRGRSNIKSHHWASKTPLISMKNALNELLKFNKNLSE